MITAPASPPGVRNRLAVLALGTALVFGCLTQGAFYADDAAIVLALVLVAVVARCTTATWRVDGAAGVCATALALFACWTVVAAARHGDLGPAVAPAAVALGLAATTWVAAGLPDSPTRVLQIVLLATGVVVALSGWLGVVLHLEPWALVSSGLWRASSTLTYANATAAFLVVTTLLATAVPTGPRPAVGRATVAVMLLGLAATMSRAGFLALAVGLVVCLALPAQRARVTALWPAIPAAAVAAAGLLPGLVAGSPAQPLPALAGLAGGVAVLLLAGRRPRVVLGLLAAALLVALASGSAGTALAGIVDTRLTGTSSERDDLRRVTTEQFLTAPVAGVGPGRIDFVYVDHAGRLVQAEYTHDEYLQTAAETGLVGAGLTVVALAAPAAGALRRRQPVALAIVAAFAVHSAFDFLWHIPVLPLLVVLATVPLLTARSLAVRSPDNPFPRQH